MPTPNGRRAFGSLAAATLVTGLAGCVNLGALTEPDSVTTYREGVEQYRAAYTRWEDARRKIRADRWQDGKSSLDEALPPSAASVNSFAKARKLAIRSNDYELAELVEEAEASASFLHNGIDLYHEAAEEIVRETDDTQTRKTIEQARAYCRKSAEYEIAPVDEVRSKA